MEAHPYWVFTVQMEVKEVKMVQIHQVNNKYRPTFTQSKWSATRVTCTKKAQFCALHWLVFGE